jgi:hypothetical protein
MLQTLVGYASLIENPTNAALAKRLEALHWSHNSPLAVNRRCCHLAAGVRAIGAARVLRLTPFS